jgi:hypothetical protein
MLIGSQATGPPISPRPSPAAQASPASTSQLTPWVPHDSVTFKKSANGRDVMLGHGASGTVYDGFFKGKRCAIKVLNEKNAKEPLQVEAFKKEIEVLFSLNHENICRALGGCLDNDPAQGIYPLILLEILAYKLSDVLANPKGFPDFNNQSA